MGKKYLIVRTDRVGDVLLTTPLNAAIRAADPKAHITWLVRPYTAPLLEHNPDVDQILLDQGGSIAPLVDVLKSNRFDVAIVAYPRWRVVWTLYKAGIPMRIGPASKLYTLLLTHRIWQHRSDGKKHEADYNLELLAPLGIPFQRYPTRLILTEDEKHTAHRTLESHRISFHKPVVVLHPGSGGSSARWPLIHFMELGDRLQEMGCDVVITGGPGEDYQTIMIDQMRRIPVFIAAGSVRLRELAALFSQVQLVVSNSTGPLHMAVALGIPTVSLYSAIPTCHPQRWGPYPAYVEKDAEHTVVVAPDNGLPQADMALISVDKVMELCRKRLTETASTRVSAGQPTGQAG